MDLRMDRSVGVCKTVGMNGLKLSINLVDLGIVCDEVFEVSG
jgi:hypothetical protein